MGQVHDIVGVQGLRLVRRAVGVVMRVTVVVVMAAAMPGKMDMRPRRMGGVLPVGLVRMRHRSPSEEHMDQHEKGGRPSHVEPSRRRLTSLEASLGRIVRQGRSRPRIPRVEWESVSSLSRLARTSMERPPFEQKQHATHQSRKNGAHSPQERDGDPGIRGYAVAPQEKIE